MKKIYLLLLAFTLTTAVFAQDHTEAEAPVLKSKKGELYLPEMDEWALGVSANPFLDYLGNFLNLGGNVTPTFEFAENPANNIALFGKYVVDENTAYRIRFNVNVRSTTNKAVVAMNELTPDPNYPAFVDDWQKVNTTAIVIAPGYEKRRGTTRLQGIYGGELIVGFNKQNVKYEYGNAITGDFTAPATTNFVGYGFGSNLIGTPVAASTRVVEDKSGTNFLIGARGFIGVEYFFAPKISIGGEFGYMFGVQTQGRAVTTAESWDGTNANTRQTKIDSYRNGGVNNIGVGLDNLNGNITLLFYF